MNKLRLLLGAALMVSSTANVLGQGARNIVISEVLTNNTQSIVDEFGQREAWIELENTSRPWYVHHHRPISSRQVALCTRTNLAHEHHPKWR